MVRAVIYVGMNAKYRESAQDTCFCCFFDTFSDCRDILLRNSTADNSGFIFKCLFTVRVHRLEFNFTMAILAAAAGLFCIFVFLVNRFCKCFFVGNLRCTYIRLYLVFAQQSVYDNFKVKLTHTCNDSLAGLLIRMSTECRVFLCQLRQSLAHLALASLCLRLNSKFNNRLRELHGFQNNRMLLITDCIACCRNLKSYRCRDISGINSVEFSPLIRMHLKDTSNTFLFIFCCIQYIRTGVHRTGINSEECQFPNKRISHNLKCQS